jgi:hypothetical protein
MSTPTNLEKNRARNRAYYKANRARTCAQKKAYREANRDKVFAYREKHRARDKEYSLKRNYGISQAQYDQMFQSQGGKCAICSRGDLKLSVDHCHSSGKVRGLLCTNCNTSLGGFRDSTEALLSAVQYLKQHA